jgi:hypothetical protein
MQHQFVCIAYEVSLTSHMTYFGNFWLDSVLLLLKSSFFHSVAFTCVQFLFACHVYDLYCFVLSCFDDVSR